MYLVMYIKSKKAYSLHLISWLSVIRALSSVGSEHLVYTQGVGGSNPSAPTTLTPLIQVGFFYFQIQVMDSTWSILFIKNTEKPKPTLKEQWHNGQAATQLFSAPNSF